MALWQLIFFFKKLLEVRLRVRILGLKATLFMADVAVRFTKT